MIVIEMIIIDFINILDMVEINNIGIVCKIKKNSK